jgi:hypothetical protein
MSDKEPSKFGRTPWDVLLELSGRRSFLVWACLIGWGIVIAGAVGWYHNALPVRDASKSTMQTAPSYYLHWSIHATSADHERCSAAARSVQSTSGTEATEDHTSGTSEAFIVGVNASFISAVGCAGLASAPLSIVFVAGPDQTGTQKRERLLRRLLDAALPPSQLSGRSGNGDA